MATYKVQAPDGSVIELEGPDGASDAQIIQAAQAAYAQRSPAAEPQTTAGGLAGATARGAALPVAGATLGAALGAPIGGVGAVPGAIAGAGAGALVQFVGDPVVDLVNRTLGTQYRRPTEAMTDLLTRLGVPQADTEAERIVQATSTGLAGAGGTSALGRAVQVAAGRAAPVAQGVGGALAAQPLQQMAGGAAAGAAGQTAQEMGAGTGGQVAASLAGGVLGAAATAPRRLAQPSAIERTTREATARGIPVLTSDVAPPQTFIGRTGQQVGERIPIAGTGPLREAQQTARVSAVRDLLRQFGADDAANASESVMRDLATKRSADLTKYSGLKGEVIDRLSSAGAVPVTRASQAIDAEIARLQGLRSEQYTPIIRTLQDWKSSLQGQTLRNIETLRAQIGTAFSGPELASIRGAGEKSLSAVYGPLRQDMQDFIGRVGLPRDVAKWQVANRRLSDLADDLDVSTVKSVLRSGKATPEDVNRLLFSKKPSEIRALYSGLTQTGQANARTAILARVADDARYTLPDGSAAYSPERFMASLKKLDPQVGVFFKGDNRAQVDGLVRALNLTTRAGQAPVVTSTGQQAVPFLAGSFLVDMLGTAGAATATAGGVGLMARVYESAPVRNLMIQLGRTKSGGTEEAAILKRLISTMQVQADKVQSAQGE